MEAKMIIKIFKHQPVRIIFILLVALALSRPHFGQEGAVKGIVSDKSGNPLKDVKITFIDVQSGNKFTLKSNKEGKFLRFAMPPAQYRVSVELEGYKPFETGLIVIFGKDEMLNITLEKIPPKVEEDKDFIDGLNCFKQGQYKEASEYFEKVAAKFPDSSEAFYSLGVSFLRNGDSDKAIARFEKALQIKPDMVEVYFAMGECYFNDRGAQKTNWKIKKFNKEE